MWENGSSRAPNFDEVRRTPLATARILPRPRLSMVMIRSASPSLWVRSTTASSRYVGTSLLSRTCQGLRRNDAAGRGSDGRRRRRRRPHASGARPPASRPDKLPTHVAIVMDGNGRWAKARNLPRTEGHARGEASLFDVIEGAIEVGVRYLSAYAFSTENWSRSPDEVRWLMGFNRDVIRRRRDQMDAHGGAGALGRSTAAAVAQRDHASWRTPSGGRSTTTC